MEAARPPPPSAPLHHPLTTHSPGPASLPRLPRARPCPPEPPSPTSTPPPNPQHPPAVRPRSPAHLAWPLAAGGGLWSAGSRLVKGKRMFQAHAPPGRHTHAVPASTATAGGWAATGLPPAGTPAWAAAGPAPEERVRRSRRRTAGRGAMGRAAAVAASSRGALCSLALPHGRAHAGRAMLGVGGCGPLSADVSCGYKQGQGDMYGAIVM